MTEGTGEIRQFMGWNDRMVFVTRLELCAARLLAHEEAAALHEGLADRTMIYRRRPHE